MEATRRGGYRDGGPHYESLHPCWHIDRCLSPNENRKKILLENVKASIRFRIRTQRPSEESVLLLASLSSSEGHSHLFLYETDFLPPLCLVNQAQNRFYPWDELKKDGWHFCTHPIICQPFCRTYSAGRIPSSAPFFFKRTGAGTCECVVPQLLPPSARPSLTD